jgi:hypothetical protein
MRMEKKFVRRRLVVYVLAITSLFLTVHYLNNHYKVTTCNRTADGLVCHTTWKA